MRKFDRINCICRIKEFLSNSGLAWFKYDQLNVAETNIVLPGPYWALKSYFCNRRNNFWILGGHVTIDLLKIDFNGWWSLLMVNLRPHKYSWKRSTQESLFQFGQIVSRNHVRDGRNILLDGTFGFLMTHGFVCRVLLIL